MPPPGATGSISALRPIDTTFLLRITAWGTRTTLVMDRATESEADSDTVATKWASPLYVAVVDVSVRVSRGDIAWQARERGAAGVD